jgi:septal ring factor EnvC (AmiA/AmiB activator)
MEQSEGFKSVDSQIKSLEQELSLCNEAIKDVEQSGKDVEKEIEEHFARCMNSLAARKEVLLREVSQNITNQRMIPSCFFSLNLN